MTVAMVYLATLSSPWRMVSPANGDNTVTNLKDIMATKCAAELLNWLRGSRASIIVLIRLGIANRHIRINRAAITMVGIVAAVLVR